MTELVAVIESPLYLARAEKLMSEDERAQVIDMVAADPMAGVVVKGTRGLRKLRIPLQGRGKRGGGRVIYWFYTELCPIVLMKVFAKNEAGDLTGEDRKQLMALSEILFGQFGAKR